MAAPGKPPTVDSQPVAARPCRDFTPHGWYYNITANVPTPLVLPLALVMPDKP